MLQIQGKCSGNTCVVGVALVTSIEGNITCAMHHASTTLRAYALTHMTPYTTGLSGSERQGKVRTQTGY
jgi:hypothetical protein